MMYRYIFQGGPYTLNDYRKLLDELQEIIAFLEKDYSKNLVRIETLKIVCSIISALDILISTY